MTPPGKSDSITVRAELRASIEPNYRANQTVSVKVSEVGSYDMREVLIVVAKDGEESVIALEPAAAAFVAGHLAALSGAVFG